MSNELAVIEERPGVGLSLMEGEPEMAVAYAKRAAAALQSVIVEGSGFVKIQGKKHITIEGWQVLAAATNHSIEVEWSRPMEEPKGAWEARAVVRDVSGQTVAAGEAMASPDERAPWTRNAYSIRSMAQTRAMSRAAASRLRYIPTLAGFSGTPAEEMPGDTQMPKAGKAEELWAQRYRELHALYGEQHPKMGKQRLKDELHRLIKSAGVETATDLADDAKYADAHDAVSGLVGGKPGEDKGGLPVADPDEVIEGEVVEEKKSDEEIADEIMDELDAVKE